MGLIASICCMGCGQKKTELPHSSNTKTEKKVIDIRHMYFSMVGDSITEGARIQLKKELPNMTVKTDVGLQVVKADRYLVATRLSDGTFGKGVVIELGVNGPFSEATGEKLIRMIGSRTPIFWLTLHTGHDIGTWRGMFRNLMKRLAEKHSNLVLVDWDSYAKKHKDWFYHDGTHLTPEGQKGYAKFIRDTLKQYYQQHS